MEELFGKTRAELEHFASRLGHPAFRGKQLADWLYHKEARSFEAMTNLPAPLRTQLATEAEISRSEVVDCTTSADGTRKFVLRLSDGEHIESVLLPYPDRTSVCVSSQIGCAAGCLFCATAQCGLVRNLTADEILDQVLTLQKQAGKRVTHVVFMGMGEPLANLSNVLQAISLLNEEIGISMRRIAISTVGITPSIRKLAELDLQLTLAISLHAPDDLLRKRLIPFASRYPLDELLDACRDYANHTKRRVTFEYLLLKGVNDSAGQAAALARLLKGMLCHVNLIPFNEVSGNDFRRPAQGAIAAFRKTLEREGIEVTQRMERGHSASAACGQLRRRFISE